MKDPEMALDFRPPPKTEPLLDLGADLDDLFGIAPWIVVSGVVLLAAVIAVLIHALL